MLSGQRECMGGKDEDRFAQLVYAHSSAVGDYLRRRLYPLSHADLDDLVEETMIVVWRRLDAVPADAELPWMLGVARNVLRNARRSKNRRSAFEASLSPPCRRRLGRRARHRRRNPCATR